MSSYADMYVGGIRFLTFRNLVDPSVNLLFRATELHWARIRAGERWEDADDPDEEVEALRAVAPASVLLDRLATLGIGHSKVVEAFARMVSEQQRQLDRREGLFDINLGRETAARLKAEREALENLTWEEWQRQVRDQVEKDTSDDGYDDDAPGSLRWLLGLWDDVDPRWVLRALGDTFPEADVTLDITDLLVGGWFDPNRDPRDSALEYFTWIAATSAPAIVLVEGSSDAELLQLGLQVVRPHLVDFVRFTDFSLRPEAGAAALVRQVRALAAAGIPNRTIAMFDHDSGAADAMRPLMETKLPSNFRVLTYPDLDLARAYPTMGPDGLSEMDVNGLACSLELYLGRDVLTDTEGHLRPVQWTGYVQRLNRYQGQVIDKAAIQEEFRRKAARALTNPVVREGQDWSGIDAILDLVLAELETMH